MMAQSLAGQLLLAAPTLSDPNFARTVVLVGTHSEEGAMGVVLNRPSAVTIAEAVPALEEAMGPDEPVFVGGPVAPTSIVMLAEFVDPADAGMLILGRIGLPGAEADVEALAEVTLRRRAFAGYAGWGEGQLDAELDNGDWITHQALPDDVFAAEPQSLWSAILARKGGSYALVARMPVDPSVN